MHPYVPECINPNMFFFLVSFFLPRLLHLQKLNPGQNRRRRFWPDRATERSERPGGSSWADATTHGFIFFFFAF